MAFDPHDLTVLSYASGFTYWHYVTDDTAEEVRSPGYFDTASRVFRNNDRIDVFAADETFDAIITTNGRVRLRTE